MLARGLAGLGAGRSLCCIDYFFVARCGDHCLCNKNLVADRAVLALGLAGLGAGRCNCRVDDLGVSLGGDFLGLGLTAGRAGKGLDTLVLAGRRSGDLAGVPVVARCGDLFHTGEDRAADRALRTGRMTSLGAGSGLFRNFNRSMSSLVDRFGLGFLADRAGKGLDTGVLTGGRSGHLALIPAVAGGGDFLRPGRTAPLVGAGVGLDTDVFTGGGSGHLALIPAVALCRNGFTRLLYFITNLAIGIAGVAGLGAGRLTASTNLGQRVVIRPVGFEGQVGEGIEPCVTPLYIFDLIRLIGTVAHGSGDEPTGEVIAFAGKATFGKRVAPT